MILDVLIRFRNLIGYGFLLLVIGLMYLDLQATDKRLAVQRAKTAELEREIEFQNVAVNAWKADADKRAAEAKKAMAAAKKQDVVHVTKAQKILVEVPVNSDECVAALELLRKYQ